MSVKKKEEKDEGQDTWPIVERMHSRLITKGDKAIRHCFATFSGEIKNPYHPGAKSFYAVVNGVRVELPTHVNAGDVLSIVAVMDDCVRVSASSQSTKESTP